MAISRHAGDGSRSFALSGLTAPDGRLDRGLRRGLLQPAPDAELNDGKVVLHFSGSWTNKEIEAPPDLLDRFLLLHGADDGQILDFVRRFGPIFCCREHGLPMTHWTLGGPKIRIHQGLYLLDADIDSQGYYSEPVRTWRTLSQMAQSLLQIFAALRLGTGPEENDSRNAWELFLLPEDVTEMPRADYSQVQILTDSWMMLGDVRPRLARDAWRSPALLAGRRTSIELEGWNVLGAAAIGLLSVIADAPHVATCSHCGKVYTPTRRPARGRRSYCPECRGKHAASTAYKRGLND